MIHSDRARAEPDDQQLAAADASDAAGRRHARRPPGSSWTESPGTTISEKYGTVAGSTSATGSQRSASIEARST